GQMEAGDMAGAAKTADEVFAAALAIENVREPENVRYLRRAAQVYYVVGNAAGGQRAMAMAGGEAGGPADARGVPATGPVYAPATVPAAGPATMPAARPATRPAT